VAVVHVDAEHTSGRYRHREPPISHGEIATVGVQTPRRAAGVDSRPRAEGVANGRTEEESIATAAGYTSARQRPRIESRSTVAAADPAVGVGEVTGVVGREHGFWHRPDSRQTGTVEPLRSRGTADVDVR